MLQPKPLIRVVLALSFALASCASATESASTDPLVMHEGRTLSSDGVPIHYVAGGQGDLALVFVHGWLGDAGVWQAEMTRFAPHDRVVALDLAGHGQSGHGRSDWSVPRFAADVAAVVHALGLEHVVLLGHSMSGAITVEAARLLGERVVALVPVDTLNDAEWDLPPEVWQQFFAGLRADFPAGVEGFFRGRLAAPGSPPEVIDRIVAGARSADPAIAVPMLERAREYDLRAGLRALRVPIHAINSDLNPTNLETNRRYAARFDVELLAGLGHWPHLEDPRAFGDALERVLATVAGP